MRIALVDGAGSPAAAALAAALHASGRGPVLLTTDPDHAPAGVSVVPLRSLPARPLRSRGIGDRLEHLPHAVLALARGRFDVVHAFRPADALAAVASARRWSGPAVLTFAEPLTRETIANRRLRVATLEEAVRDADAVLAGSAEAQASLRRLLAIDAGCLEPADAAGHLALYARLVRQARPSTA